MLKDFFFPKFVVHIHASRKIWFKVLESMDPEMLAIILFHDFFSREIFLKRILFFNCSPKVFLLSQHNSNKAKIKLHES